MEGGLSVSVVHLETDASVSQSQFRNGPAGRRVYFAGAGLVLRSEDMQPILVRPVPLGYVNCALHAEALALHLGVRLAHELQATTLRARNDCAPLVDVLNGEGKFEDPTLDRLANELRDEVAEFQQFKLLWAPSFHGRSRGDGVPTADHLAREAAGLAARTNHRRH
jgi:hypothetical protein